MREGNDLVRPPRDAVSARIAEEIGFLRYRRLHIQAMRIFCGIDGERALTAVKIHRFVGGIFLTVF